MMMTFLTGVGLAGVAAGVFVIAKSRLPGVHDTVVDAALFAKQDRGVATRLGILVIAVGAVLVLLDLAGIVLSAATAAIVVFLGVGFLVAHRNYGKHLRAARRELAVASDAQGASTDLTSERPFGPRIG